jgi:tRNA(fMet)-specific endonuclease VapC
MPRYMLDTNICIYVMKNHPPRLRERFEWLTGNLCISSITLAELHYGAEKSARRYENLQGIEQFIDKLEVLAFSAIAAAHFGQIRAALQRIGQPAGLFDMLIGAHARAEGLILVTNNAREFSRLPGVQCENWL